MIIEIMNFYFMLFYILKLFLVLRLRCLVVSDLRSETKVTALCSNCSAKV